MVELSFMDLKMKYKVAIAISVLAAISTVIPAQASKPCFFGYYAHCSWTPLSTVICLIIAAVLYWFGMMRRS